ncbi:MAG: mechanosensitive ion channel domain-containing protein [Candidatus Altiarchaeota archaeon]
MNVLTIIYSSIKPYLPNLIWIIIVVAATKIVLRSFNQIIRHLYRKYKIPKRNYLIIRNIALFTIYFTAAVLILLSIPGVDEKALTLIGIGLGVLVSLSSTSTVGNIVAGVIIHLTRPITEGDRVEIDGIEGDVLSIELLFMHIKTIRNEIVSIPSLQVLTNRIINYSHMEHVAVPVSVSIGYGVGSAKVKKLLAKAALETRDIVRKPEPYVLITRLGDYSVTYELNAFTCHHHGLPKIKSNLAESVLKAFADEGVEILSPMYVATREHVRGEKVLPSKEDTVVSHHEIVGHHENIEHLHNAKERLDEKKRSPTTIEEIHREHHIQELKSKK